METMLAPRRGAVSFAEFDSIRPGDTAVISKQITERDVTAFAELSGDFNPLHMEEEFARRTHLQRRVVHGMLVASFVSTLIGMQLPGAGSLWMQQNFRWRAPVFIDDTLEITLRVVRKSAGSRTVSIVITAMNQNGRQIMEGEGTVSVPEVRRGSTEIPIHASVAFISGGSRGIGAATARALAQLGASVLVNYRQSAEQAEDLCHEIAISGGTAVPVQADVNDLEAVRGAAAVARDKFGKPTDILIHCAGGTIAPKAFQDTAWDDVQRVLDVQLRGAFHCAKAMVPGMMELKSGRIVNIGSILTWNVPPPQWTGFIIAKSALKSFTRSLAAELGPSGIRVNMVSAGTTETDSTLQIPERMRKVQAMQTPLRRLAVPEDIAQTAVFLCTEASRFITGADIPVCGGIGM